MTGRLPMRHGLLRPPMYGQPGGLDGEVTLAQLLSRRRLRDAGRRQVAHGRERASRNRSTSASTTSTGSSPCPTCTRSGGTRTSSPRSSTARNAREWVENLPFNKCFVHATRGGDAENVEEVTIPVLSLLDDKWTDYSLDFIRRMGEASERSPGSSTTARAGAHFDNYPHERFLGSSPAKHPYKDTIVELDDIVGRLVAELEATGQIDDTLIFLSSDNGPEMETWPDAAYSPFRSAKGIDLGGRPAGAGHRHVAGHDPTPTGRATGCSRRWICSTRSCDLAAADDAHPERSLHRRRRPDVVPARRRRRVEPQVSSTTGSPTCSPRLRVGEWKFMVASTSDDDRDCLNLGGFTGVTQKYTHGRLYNLYLDPKESRSYMIRKLAYIDSFTSGIARPLHHVTASTRRSLADRRDELKARVAAGGRRRRPGRAEWIRRGGRLLGIAERTAGATAGARARSTAATTRMAGAISHGWKPSAVNRPVSIEEPSAWRVPFTARGTGGGHVGAEEARVPPGGHRRPRPRCTKRWWCWVAHLHGLARGGGQHGLAPGCGGWTWNVTTGPALSSTVPTKQPWPAPVSYPSPNRWPACCRLAQARRPPCWKSRPTVAHLIAPRR